VKRVTDAPGIATEVLQPMETASNQPDFEG
jgi:hypothetical protein